MPPFPSDVWQIHGPDTNARPRVVVIGGTHGDEIVGVEVVRALLRRFGLEDAPAGRYERAEVTGSLFLAYGNPEAIRLRRRAASGGRDLNRCFIAADLDRPAAPDDTPDLLRARELAPILAQADYVFDLHGTSSASPAFVCFGTYSSAHERLYRLLPVAYVLTDPEDVLARDEGRPGRGTTDAFVEGHGGIALGYETGKEDDLGRVATVIEDVLRLLREVGSLPPDTDTPVVSGAPPVFALAHSIHAATDGFAYAPGMDAGWQAVAAGQLVGTYGDGREERIPEDGMLVFPKAAAKVVAGKNLYYLARSV